MQDGTATVRDVSTRGFLAATGLLGRFFTLRTDHGGILHRASSGCVVHGAIAGEGTSPVLLFVPAGSLSVAYLVGKTIRFDDGPWCGDVAGFRLDGDIGEAGITLRNPTTGLYLCANLPAEEGHVGTVSADRAAPGPWERFEAAVAEIVSADIDAVAQRLLALSDRIDRDGAFDASVDDEDLDLFLTIAETRGLDEMDRLALRIAGDPRLAHRIAATTNDPWLGRALPTLADWLAAGRPATVEADTGPEWDFLAGAGEDGVFGTFGQLLNHRARRQIAPRKGACIIATARNEGIYLLEWLAYHRALGFEHFFICSNDNTDESDAMLAALSQAGVISWTRSVIGRQVRPQCKAYSYTLQMLPDVTDYAWAAIIDLDEFVVLDHGRYGTIDDFLSYHERQPVDAIALNWRFAGALGSDGWRDEPVVTRFASTVPDPNRHVKSIVRPGHFMHSHPHRPYATNGYGEIFRDASGTEQPISAFVPHDFDHGWINHYIYKSADEFAWRRARNRGDGYVESDIAIRRLDAHLIGEYLDLKADLDAALSPDPYAGRPIDGHHLDDLLAIPGVAAARLAVIEAFRREVEQLRRMIADDPRFSVEGSPEWRFARELAPG